MIYGATGYTGRLIAAAAVQQGLRPVLAGRSEPALRALASELGLAYRLFRLDDAPSVRAGLADMRLVLHTAGPFSATSAPMVDGCLQQKVHYLDITGEIDVFEAIQSRHDEAQRAGVLLCPGVGFDVIPTDCLAARLKEALPDATSLRLGFDSRSGPSPGTAKTALQGLAGGGRVRRDGRLETVPLAWKCEQIDFGDGPKLAVTIPWGDVATAYYTTGIPNIETYIPMSPRAVKGLKGARWVRPLLGLAPVQRFMQRQIERRVQGPDAAKRARTPTYVWGEARNAAGVVRTARVRTANGYEVTVSGSLSVVRHLLEQQVATGFMTPARLLGPDLVTRLPGSSEILVA
jgi:short subunit dehydrogenase-like uncharacterized protein